MLKASGKLCSARFRSPESDPRPESGPENAGGQMPRPRTLPTAEWAPVAAGDPLPRVRIGPAPFPHWSQAGGPRTCRSGRMFPQLRGRSPVVGQRLRPPDPRSRRSPNLRNALGLALRRAGVTPRSGRGSAWGPRRDALVSRGTRATRAPALSREAAEQQISGKGSGGYLENTWRRSSSRGRAYLRRAGSCRRLPGARAWLSPPPNLLRWPLGEPRRLPPVLAPPRRAGGWFGFVSRLGVFCEFWGAFSGLSGAPAARRGLFTLGYTRLGVLWLPWVNGSQREIRKRE